MAEIHHRTRLDPASWPLLYTPTSTVITHHRDPAESVALANPAMRTAAQLAHELGALLAAAQTAINSQGYNGRKHNQRGEEEGVR